MCCLVHRMQNPVSVFVCQFCSKIGRNIFQEIGGSWNENQVLGFYECVWINRRVREIRHQVFGRRKKIFGRRRLLFLCSVVVRTWGFLGCDWFVVLWFSCSVAMQTWGFPWPWLSWVCCGRGRGWVCCVVAVDLAFAGFVGFVMAVVCAGLWSWLRFSALNDDSGFERFCSLTRLCILDFFGFFGFFWVLFLSAICLTI